MVDVDRFESGPDAPLRAASGAWGLVERARVLVLVEGISDQIAVEAAASVRAVDLKAQGAVIVPMGGAHAIANVVAELQLRHVTAPTCGLYDVAEEPFFGRALRSNLSDETLTRPDLERRGFFVCDRDLEDELIRAAGDVLLLDVVAAEGDRSAFATMRKQPAWRDEPTAAQARRFIGAGSRRKHRYAAALVRAIGVDDLPAPLARVIDHICD